MIPRYILTPYFLDQPLPGLESLLDPGWVVNKPALVRDKPQARMVGLYNPLAKLVRTVLESGELPVCVAGDCCTSIGVLAGLQQAGVDPTLIWFDAHGDFNTWETTPSGFLGGMPLAMLVGRGEQTIMEGMGNCVLPEDQVMLSDARNLDPGEQEKLARSGVVHLEKVQDLFEHRLPSGPIWVHFDTDVIDPVEAPAMNYPAQGGPSVDELREVFSHLASSGEITAVSISTWNPELDLDGSSQAASMGLLQELTRGGL